jgi:Ca2+-binding RTX toxin-like protein
MMSNHDEGETMRKIFGSAASLTPALLLVVINGMPAQAGPEMRCGSRPATIIGTDGDDELTGTPERDVINALMGADSVRGMEGRDLVCGGRGADFLRGGSSRDSLRGGRGADRLRAAAGDDYLDGWMGRDRLFGGSGDDGLQGGYADEYLGHNVGDGDPDRLDGGTDWDSCFANSRDRLRRCEGYVVE